MALKKKAVRIIAKFKFIQVLFLFLLRATWIISRLLSHLKFKALVVNSGDSVCHWTVEFQHPSNLIVGNNVAIGPYCRLGCGASVYIGDNVTLSRGVILETAGLKTKNFSPPFPHHYRPIVIENNVWIATNSIILGGVTIGENSVIGAGTVVTRDVPPNSIIVSSNRY